MCNCNKRASYDSNTSEHTFGKVQRGMIKVKLITDTPMVLNGDITGRMYVFRELNDVIWVDNRDAVSMKDIDKLQVIS